MRFLGANYHDRPIWFFVPTLLVGCMPWSILLVPAANPAMETVRGAAASWYPPRSVFYLAWGGVDCAVVVLLSSGKLPPYVLPRDFRQSRMADWVASWSFLDCSSLPRAPSS